jgi:site-specific recombinase XerD
MTTNASSQSVVAFTVVHEQGRVTAVSTNLPELNHFLDLLQNSRAYNTWVSYAHDLQIFFRTIDKLPETITRSDCLAFMKQQAESGCSSATINRRLAALSSLFNELELFDPDRFPRNPVTPRQRHPGARQRSQSLYQVLLMWISCLRISEAVAIRFQDIECGRRSVHIPVTKGHNARTVFMDQSTFAALNRYLEEERKALFPDVDYVFVSFKGQARGRPLTVNAVQKMIHYYADKHDLAHLHAHLFRHTGITQLVQQGMLEPAIRDMVGHRSPDSLSPYLHLCDTFVETEFERAQAGLTPATWLDTLLPGGEP